MPVYRPAWQEPVYHAVCAWLDQQRHQLTPCPAWPTTDLDRTGEQDEERTVRLVRVPEHMWGPWEAHECYLRKSPGLV